MATVTIKSGPGTSEVTIENGSVSEILAAARDEGLLNIPENPTVLINGDEADLDATVEDGDEVTFGKAAGEKGV